MDIKINRGEIRGLIGENGSGKSTFASIVAGSQFQDSGILKLEGKDYTPKNMVDAQNHGISMIIQEAGTIPGITVAANIFAGRMEEYARYGFVKFKEICRRADEILKDIGANDMRAEMMISELNFEDRKIVEIARAMVSNPELLIIDETTTALAQKGRQILYNLIERFHREKKSVLFISHNLDELMRICDAITVLRDGKVVDTLEKDQISIDKMRTLMVGRELTGSYYRVDFDGSCGEEIVLKARQITSNVLENFDLELHKGEILGIGGLADCGMHELGRILFGIDKPITGKVVLNHNNVSINNPITAIKNKMAYVSKDRDREAIILNASIKDNITIPSLRFLSQALGFISKRAEKRLAQKQVKAMQIKCRDEEQMCASLSGGNKQKVVFAKWLALNSDIMILDCPTRGIDVGVKAAMYQLMTDLKMQGKSIIMISEELLELIGMSDRIIAIKDGKLQAVLKRSADLSENQIIRYII